MNPSYTKNLEVFKYSDFENIESLINITRKMIGENSEILNVTSLEGSSPSREILTTR